MAKEFPALAAESKDRDEIYGLGVDIVWRKFEQSPADAATWTEQLPEGTVRTAVQENVVSSWVMKDPMRASEWLRQLPPGGSRDGSTYKLIQGSDPAAALEWAKVIAKPEMKQKAVDGIFKSWREAGPAAAAAAQADLGE